MATLLIHVVEQDTNVGVRVKAHTLIVYCD